mmetsp:Transcript_67842/g.220885  ORF Transcript_67842/g.220885 Transcript_67842/m.220885 type:complete len:225 (+) Transcript_67842:1594-2268(+)
MNTTSYPSVEDGPSCLASVSRAGTGISSRACFCNPRSSYFFAPLRLLTCCCNLPGRLLNLACNIAKCCSSTIFACGFAAAASTPRNSKGSALEALLITTMAGGSSGASPASSTSQRMATLMLWAVGMILTSRAWTGVLNATLRSCWGKTWSPSNSEPPSAGSHGPPSDSAQLTLNLLTKCPFAGLPAKTTPATSLVCPRSNWYHEALSSGSGYHAMSESIRARS